MKSVLQRLKNFFFPPEPPPPSERMRTYVFDITGGAPWEFEAKSAQRAVLMAWAKSTAWRECSEEVVKVKNTGEVVVVLTSYSNQGGNRKCSASLKGP